MDMRLSKLQEIVKDREARSAAVHGVAKSWIWLSNWTTGLFLALKFYMSTMIATHDNVWHKVNT